MHRAVVSVVVMTSYRVPTPALLQVAPELRQQDTPLQLLQLTIKLVELNMTSVLQRLQVLLVPMEYGLAMFSAFAVKRVVLHKFLLFVWLTTIAPVPDEALLPLRAEIKTVVF